MKKYTKEEVVELFNQFIDRIDDLNEWNNTTEKNAFLKEKGLIKDKLEVGKWYKWKNCLVLVTSKANNYYNWVGFENGEWRIGAYILNAFEPATKEEVEEALIKEAKKRGFDNRLNSFKSLGGCAGAGNVACCNQIRSGERKEGEYYLYSDGGYGYIFENGEWAEIIEETKEMTVEEIQEQLGHKIKIVE